MSDSLFHTMSETRRTLVDDSRSGTVLRGLCSPKIRERPLPLTICGISESFQVLEIYKRSRCGNRYPQLVADVVANSYLRLTYESGPGISGTFGTSIVLSPAFRSPGELLTFRAAPHESSIDYRDGKVFVQTLAKLADAALVSATRSYDTSLSGAPSCCDVAIDFVALRAIPILQTIPFGDAFRLFTISSMFSRTDLYDANALQWGNGGLLHRLELATLPGRSRHLFDRPCTCTEVIATKTRGSRSRRGASGAKDSPSISVEVKSCSLPIDELGIQGYLAESQNPDDDSLSIWLEWTRCPTEVPAGMSFSLTLRCSASRPE